MLQTIDPLAERPHLSLKLVRLTGPSLYIWRAVLRSQRHQSRHRVCHLLLLVFVLCSAGSRARANPPQLPHPPDAADAKRGASVPPPQSLPSPASSTTARRSHPPPAPVDPLGCTTTDVPDFRALPRQTLDKAANYLDERALLNNPGASPTTEVPARSRISTKASTISRSPNGNVEDQLRRGIARIKDAGRRPQGDARSG